MIPEILECRPGTVPEKGEIYHDCQRDDIDSSDSVTSSEFEVSLGRERSCGTGIIQAKEARVKHDGCENSTCEIPTREKIKGVIEEGTDGVMAKVVSVHDNYKYGSNNNSEQSDNSEYPELVESDTSSLSLPTLDEESLLGSIRCRFREDDIMHSFSRNSIGRNNAKQLLSRASNSFQNIFQLSACSGPPTSLYQATDSIRMHDDTGGINKSISSERRNDLKTVSQSTHVVYGERSRNRRLDAYVSSMRDAFGIEKKGKEDTLEKLFEQAETSFSEYDIIEESSKKKKESSKKKKKGYLGCPNLKNALSGHGEVQAKNSKGQTIAVTFAEEMQTSKVNANAVNIVSELKRKTMYEKNEKSLGGMFRDVMHFIEGGVPIDGIEDDSVPEDDTIGISIAHESENSTLNISVPISKFSCKNNFDKFTDSLSDISTASDNPNSQAFEKSVGTKSSRSKHSSVPNKKKGKEVYKKKNCQISEDRNDEVIRSDDLDQDPISFKTEKLLQTLENVIKNMDFEKMIFKKAIVDKTNRAGLDSSSSFSNSFGDEEIAGTKGHMYPYESIVIVCRKQNK
mmetsp:Transcript_1509/g.3256  ORF Transcript_1509/g.3256 Transcript_1509/m.3256 type:complete len:569 (+) Transcript_1509:75-1781(+)